MKILILQGFTNNKKSHHIYVCLYFISNIQYRYILTTITFVLYYLSQSPFLNVIYWLVCTLWLVEWYKSHTVLDALPQLPSNTTLSRMVQLLHRVLCVRRGFFFYWVGHCWQVDREMVLCKKQNAGAERTSVS